MLIGPATSVIWECISIYYCAFRRHWLLTVISSHPWTPTSLFCEVATLKWLRTARESSITARGVHHEPLTNSQRGESNLVRQDLIYWLSRNCKNKWQSTQWHTRTHTHIPGMLVCLLSRKPESWRPSSLSIPEMSKHALINKESDKPESKIFH